MAHLSFGISGRAVTGGAAGFLSLLFLLVWAPAAQATAPTLLCLTGKCHPGFTSEKFIHGPIATGMCPLCHDEGLKPSSLPQGHPDTKIDPGSEKCLLCHEEIKALMDLGFIHTPVADGDCIDCHDPHQSDNSFFLKEAPGRQGNRRVVAPVCHSCHEPGDSSWFDDFHATEAILDCTVCHNAHASSEQFQLTRYVRDVYLRSAIMDAGELREQGKLAAAASSYIKALSVFPGDTKTALLLAEVYGAQDKWQKAFNIYADILEAQPDHLEALIGAGDAVEKSDGPAAALGYYKKALDAAPDRADLHIRVGAVYQARGQLQEALAEFGKAVELAPDSARAYRKLAGIYEAMGRPADADAARKKYESLKGN